MSVHPTAVIGSDVRLGRGTTVGPYAILEGEVQIGADCTIYGHAYLRGPLTIGDGSTVHMGAVVGHLPQDKSFDPSAVTSVEIGRRNTIREYATVHRATRDGAATRLGDDCFLMAHAHVAHDCTVGDEVVICNNALLAGHVEVGDRVFVSGNVVVHQFCRIGAVAMLGGACQVGQDVPPYTTVTGRSRISGLNIVGLRRAGMSAEVRLAIKAAYRALFAHRDDLETALATLGRAPDIPEIRRIRDFYRRSRRGFMWPPRDGRGRLGGRDAVARDDVQEAD